MFPYVCSKMSQMVRYEDCTFAIEEDKRSTARIQLFSNLKCPNIYTFEASFFGYVKKNEKRHFTVEGYRMLGQVLGKSMYVCERRRFEEGRESLMIEKWGREVVMGGDETMDGDGSDSCPEEFSVL